MDDKVARLLCQLKEGKEFTKGQVQEALQFYQSIIDEKKALHDFCELDGKNINKDNATGHLNKELQQVQVDNRVLSKEVDYYVRKASESATIGNTRQFEKEYEHSDEIKTLAAELKQAHLDLQFTKQKLKESEDIIENFKIQYEKQRDENTPVKMQLEQYKSEKESIKSQLDKITKDYEAAIRSLNHYKASSADLAQQLEKLRLDYKNEIDRYTNKEKLSRKIYEGAEHKNEEHHQHKEQTQPKAFEKLRQENTQLKEDKLKLSEQINELRNRLSVLAGHKLTDGNPAIADLSDPFRPTNIAEQFRQLYDDEWTCAFEELGVSFERDEEIIDFLACIIKDIDRFCIRAGSQQLEHLKYFAKLVIQDPEYQPDAKEEKGNKVLKCDQIIPMTRAQEELADKMLKDFRKSLGMISKTPLLVIFRQASKSIKDKIGPKPPKGLEDFLEKAFELIWVMKMQDPAMEFVWSKPGDNFDKNMYTHYTKRGSKVAQCIWPAIVLHKAGPLMSKGVVQGN
ncbi:CAP-Gly domain-containing linker protein 1-like isoform X2 [Ruditapes philippinarum]|nr:CAP-Gly domain-containing linker protein 1-like isoform X2 [Ruditapes philippinarum]